MKRGRKGRPKKEEISEDYCFICKDGGLLLVCEYKKEELCLFCRGKSQSLSLCNFLRWHCLKAYHPQCVGKDPTFLETGERWTCSWHSCFICKRCPEFHCFCCPNAVCKRCIKAAEFVQVRGKKGFCNHCLKLVLLIEENVDVDSDGGKIDFKDRDTYEFLFMEYWELINEKEGLILEDLHSAHALLKKGESYKNGSNSDRFVEGEEEDQVSMSDFGDDLDDQREEGSFSLVEESKGKQYGPMKTMKRKVKSKKTEFIGWGSKSLIEFLASIGMDTSKPFSQYEVNDIIKEYVNKNKLLHPERKKKVLCDSKLQSVFRRKSVNRNKIYDLLESHFAENQEQSEEDEFRYISAEDKEEGILKAFKRQKRSSSDRRTHEKEKVLEAQRSCFASVTSKNIKLVYLKRSLIEDLLKNREIFEYKVLGSFVRVKYDPNDYLQRNSHQLLQVTGIQMALKTGDSSSEIILQVSNIKKEIHIGMLSDDDFSVEECEDLRQRVKDGLIKRPTIVELEQKARILHEDITNHWIEGELALLQNLIDRANEKGWRRELCEYLERRQLLQTPSERLRLLQEVPKVIADEIELEATPLDSPDDEKQGSDSSPRSTLAGASEILDDLAGNGIASNLEVGKTDSAGDGAVYYRKSGMRENEGIADAVDKNAASEIVMSNLAGKGDAFNERAAEKEADGTAEKEAEGIGAACMVSGQNEKEEERHLSDVVVLEEQQLHSDTVVPEDHQHNSDVFVPGEQHQSSSYVTEEQHQPKEVGDSFGQTHLVVSDENEGDEGKMDGKNVLGIELIDLVDDEDEAPGDVTGNWILEDSESNIWHYVDPSGDIQGPFSMSLLKKWSQNNYFLPDFKVWKTGQTKEAAILLTDVLAGCSPKT